MEGTGNDMKLAAFVFFSFFFLSNYLLFVIRQFGEQVKADMIDGIGW